ncbi:AraC family transcriptional regulator [Celeribacter sp. ASW11-22]|nr:AraC family transcriptional regulator [Celeribacter litoreus]
MLDYRPSLTSRAAAIAKAGETVELTEGVGLFSATSTSSPLALFLDPVAIIVFQGEMEVTIGSAILTYRPGQSFVGSIAMPVTGRLTQATTAEPYLAISLSLARETLADLLAEAPQVMAQQGKCYALGPVPEGIPEACDRLLSLQSDDDRTILGPMIRREILWRLLRGPQAPALHQIVAADPRLAQVRRALGWIREHLSETVPIRDMASCAGMSEASFRRHFKAATGMSPLTYQKTLRLQAARRAILGGTEIARAGFDVGYVSPSQFSREYARLFGLPPSRDRAQVLAGQA